MSSKIEVAVSIETFRDIFNELDRTGITFSCIFEKLDGSVRGISARMLGPVAFNYKKRESYANVVDIDLPVGFNNDRKIVLQRVERLIVNGTNFISNGR